MCTRRAKSSFGCNCRRISVALQGWTLILHVEESLCVSTELPDKAASIVSDSWIYACMGVLWVIDCSRQWDITINTVDIGCHTSPARSLRFPPRSRLDPQTTHTRTVRSAMRKRIFHPRRISPSVSRECHTSPDLCLVLDLWRSASHVSPRIPK